MKISKANHSSEAFNKNIQNHIDVKLTWALRRYSVVRIVFFSLAIFAVVFMWLYWSPRCQSRFKHRRALLGRLLAVFFAVQTTVKWCPFSILMFSRSASNKKRLENCGSPNQWQCWRIYKIYNIVLIESKAVTWRIDRLRLPTFSSNF